MKKSQFVLILLSACFFSFLGGGLSVQLFSGNPAFAAGPYKEVVAYSFRLVDKKEKTRALLYASEDSEKTYFNLSDKKGRLRILLKVDDAGIPAAHFWDKGAEGKFEITANYPSINFWDDNNELCYQVPILKDLIKKNKNEND